jgi:hypothetical protein
MERSNLRFKSESKVKTESIESLGKKIMKKYNQQPTGWNMFLDFKGNMLVLGPEEGYMMKMIHINPKEQTGVGIKIDGNSEMRRILKGAPTYGFRPVSKPQAKEIFDSFRQERKNRLISKILEKKPISTSELQKKKLGAVLSGPVIAHPNLTTISKSQRELESKLQIEAQKLFRKKYPHRAAIYT